ncbi:MAG TPA: hypothetical protein VGM44_15805, partial [Polyangiaceae bacterium]
MQTLSTFVLLVPLVSGCGSGEKSDSSGAAGAGGNTTDAGSARGGSAGSSPDLNVGSDGGASDIFDPDGGVTNLKLSVTADPL